MKLAPSTPIHVTYPARATDRDQWIISRRPPRELLDPQKPYAFLVEDECSATGEVVPVATIFLTNRECLWRCVMCDLWRNTLTTTTPAGAIPAQIDYALSRLPPARQIKLYNSGSFFDPHAIPPGDYQAIADRLTQFERVIVECHPSLIGESCLQLRDLLTAQLEVAMGLETANPEVLARLNKRMTLESFRKAASFLKSHAIDLRTFILLNPPFLPPQDALHWAKRSLDFAFDCGATAATLIPTRANNGAMESLTQSGDFNPLPPHLLVDLLEAALTYGLTLKQGRVFADRWDLASTIQTPQFDRLQQMNLRQTILEPTPDYSPSPRS